MTTETHVGRALLRAPVLLGITALSVVLAFAAACGGEEQTRTPTPGPSAPAAETPRGTPPGAKPTATVAKPTATVAQPTPTVAQPTPTVAQPAPTVGAKPTGAAQPTPTAPVVVQVSVDNAPGWGPEDAPVTIVEFSDYL